MFSASRKRFTLAANGLSKIPFLHNSVLQQVFSAPPNKLAISVEQPGLAVQQYTYGDIQKDVLDVAMRALRPAVCGGISGSTDLETLLRKPIASSPFHPGIKDAIPMSKIIDDGNYNAGILAKPGYEFVVSLLAQWSMNMMSVPMCHTHHFGTELTHVFENSRMRTLMVDTMCKVSKLPPSFTESNELENKRFDVKCTLDTTEALRLLRQHRDQGEWELQLLPPEEMRTALRTADDVLTRITDLEEEQKESVRQEEIEEARRLFRGYMMPPDSSTANIGSTLYKEHFDYIATIPGALELMKMSSKYTSKDSDCLMIYTSGTTNKPKGVVHTHRSVSNQVEILQHAWKWQKDDTILNVLPLHHVHGLVNVTLCALASQAHCVFTPFDNAHRIAKRLEKGDISLFMGVPTIYSKLDMAIRTKMSPVEQAAWKKSVSQNIRLMVSGSAALPVPVLEAWKELSGHTLLERYGMTEIGMALSQPFQPVNKRVPGSVGTPLPTVRAYCDETEVASAAGAGAEVAPESRSKDPNVSDGSLMISSPSVFSRYFGNPDATAKEVYYHPTTNEAFFKTGDTVQVLKDRALFTIMGRSSVDIIKRSGFKLSALEIEAELLRCEGVLEVAVVGVSDPVVGEEVCALIVVPDNNGEKWIPAIKVSIAERLAKYKVPTQYVVVRDAIPRNAMGKINKKELKKAYDLK